MQYLTPRIPPPPNHLPSGGAAWPYQDGKGWSFRLHILSQDIFHSGVPSEAAARKEMNLRRPAIEGRGKASGLGSFLTNLAVALRGYARRRINICLRMQSLPVL